MKKNCVDEFIKQADKEGVSYMLITNNRDGYGVASNAHPLMQLGMTDFAKKLSESKIMEKYTNQQEVKEEEDDDYVN